MLLENGRASSAAALAILSLEESGKPGVLKSLALSDEPAALKEAWKNFRRHTVKNSHSILPDIIRKGGKQLTDFRAAVEGGEHSELLDGVKQLAFYVDCYGLRGNWSDPLTAVGQDLAESLVMLADTLASPTEVTVRQIHLWIEHVKPYNGSALMAKAVVAYQAALFSEGLSSISSERMAEFLGGILVPNSDA